MPQRRNGRVIRLANEFAWWLLEAEPGEYSRAELQDLWQDFCEEQNAATAGFATVLYFLKIWLVIKSLRKQHFFQLVQPTQTRTWKNACAWTAKKGEVVKRCEAQSKYHIDVK